jgi:hypothetical protein
MDFVFTQCPPLKSLFVEKNVSSVVGAATWLGDFLTVNDIVKKLQPSAEGQAFDDNQIRIDGIHNFFFYKLQTFLWRRDTKGEYTKSFKAGIRFDVTKLPPSASSQFIIKQRGWIYGEGALYKRFRDNSYVILFEHGEGHIAAVDENEGLLRDTTQCITSR